MMRRQMTLIRACVLAIAVLVVWPSNMVAQQPDDDGPRHERRRGRGPEQLRERIQDLREEGVADDDPRLERMEEMLERMQQGGPRGERRRGRGGRPGPHGLDGLGPRQYEPEEMMEFVEQHAKLRKLLMGSVESEGSSAEFLRRAVRRSGRQISEIMSATHEGQEEFANALIENAGIQLKIRERIRVYHASAKESAERDSLRDELEGLVRRQVATDLVVQAFKLDGLRERLARQEARLAKDRDRKEELASRKLERLLSGERHRMGEDGRRRPNEWRRGKGRGDFDRRRGPGR